MSNEGHASDIIAAEFAAVPLSLLRRLQHKTIQITGATGFIGSMLVKLLLFANREYDFNITVDAIVRSPSKATRVFGHLLEEPQLRLSVADLITENYPCSEIADFVIHCASITSSRVMATHPVDVALTSLLSTIRVLNGIRAKSSRVVYISSMEVYGMMARGEMAAESELGYIDLLNPRSSYSESKRMCECLCAAYHKQYGSNVSIARLAQVVGPGVQPEDSRAFTQFVRKAVSGEKIVLNTTGQSEGNYVYITDALTAILVIMLLGNGGEAYNISNESCHMSIADMANVVAKTVNPESGSVVYNIVQEDYGYAPETHLYMDSSKLRSLGWTATVNLEEAALKLADYILSSEKRHSSTTNGGANRNR